jgi:hypothetical protein
MLPKRYEWDEEVTDWFAVFLWAFSALILAFFLGLVVMFWKQVVLV